MVLYSCQNKILELSMNTNKHIKNELIFLHILNLILFMPSLSYIWFSDFKIENNIFFFIFEGVLIFLSRGVYNILIKSLCLHVFSRLSLSIRLNRPSLLAGLLNCILCPHSSYWSTNTGTSTWRGPKEKVIYEFVLGYSSRVPHVLFVLLGWEASGHTAAASWNTFASTHTHTHTHTRKISYKKLFPLNFLCKKNMPIPTRVVERGSPGNKHHS